jgi:hypothetical protein
MFRYNPISTRSNWKSAPIRTILCFSILSHAVVGQEIPEGQAKKWTISEFSLQTGLLTHAIRNGSYENFKKLAPQSVLLNKNFSEYTQWPGTIHSGNNVFSAALGLRLQDKQKASGTANPTLRFGLQYFSRTNFSAAYGRLDRKPFDTLTSAQTGSLIYRDSLSRTFMSMIQTSDKLRLEASILFRTQSKSRWSAFAGFGVAVGASIHSRTEIIQSKSTIIEDRQPQSNQIEFASSPQRFEIQSEYHSNKTNLGFSAFLPMGIDFRMSTTNPFWKQTHLFFEFRPGINSTYVPEVRRVTHAMVHYALGFRFTRDEEN